MKKVAILGYGGRGYLYARMCKQMKNDYEVVAVIDNSQDKLNLAEKMSSLNSSQLFSSLCLHRGRFPVHSPVQFNYTLHRNYTILY